MKQTTAQFDFVAQPKVTAAKPKYRDREEQLTQPLNLMNDPRVVRGNTYAAIIANKNQVPPPIKKPHKETKKPQKRVINFDTGFQPLTPRPVHNRDHFSTQTQPFVETLRDKPIQYEKQSQTDFFLDRPVQRQFDPMKGKTGTDRNTQVDENDPQLFDFNYQVQPIIDALLSKVFESSRMELYQEEELKDKEKQKIDYQKRRYAKLAEVQKLQANQNRLKQQYDRRQLQYKSSKQQQSYAQKKLISRILSKQYLKNLKNNTYMILSEEGFFRNPLQTGLYEQFVPSLYNQIIEEIHQQNRFSQFVSNTINDAKTQKIRQSKKNIDIELKKRKEKQQEIQRKKQQRENRKLEQKMRKQEEQAKNKALESSNQQNVDHPS